MTEIETTSPPTRQTASGPQPAKTTVPQREPVLITEQQVKFATAAASAPSTQESRRTLGSALKRVFAGPQEPVKRHQPKRQRFLENALMAREMDRL